MKIIKRNEKPELKFKCSICKSEWKDDTWKATEVGNSFGVMMMVGMNQQVRPMSICPVCNMKSYN